MLLQLKDVTKTYKNGVKALDHVTIDIKAGMFGLLGPNGAGKSSLMRTIATLQSPDEGTITFNGLDVHEHKMEFRKKLGYLPQEFGVYPRMSAYDLLHYLAKLKGLHNKAEREEMVEKALEVTNLSEVRHKHVAGYSGGMKQRFGIAQFCLTDQS
jgi:ABC-type multidrug transport system, ATPase component